MAETLRPISRILPKELKIPPLVVGPSGGFELLERSHFKSRDLARGGVFSPLGVEKGAGYVVSSERDPNN